MDSKPNRDISMLFQVDTFEGLNYLLNLEESVVKKESKAGEVYLKSVDVIDTQRGIIKITAPYSKEFLIQLVKEKAGGKKLSDVEAIKAYNAIGAIENFYAITTGTDLVEQ